MYTQQEVIEKMIPVLKQYPIKRAALFGSYARNEQTEKSDLDIVLEPFPDTCVRIFYFLVDLEDTLRMKADVLTTRQLMSEEDYDIHGPFRERVKKDLRWFYEL